MSTPAASSSAVSPPVVVTGGFAGSGASSALATPPRSGGSGQELGEAEPEFPRLASTPDPCPGFGSGFASNALLANGGGGPLGGGGGLFRGPSFDAGVAAAAAMAAAAAVSVTGGSGAQQGLRPPSSDAGDVPPTDPRKSTAYFFLSIYHSFCFAGALSTLLAAFLGALISCVVAYYSDWESMDLSMDGLSWRHGLIVFSSLALLIEVVFLSEIATNICTCAFRLAWDMMFQREALLEVRRTLTDQVLEVDDEVDWGRWVDLGLQAFVHGLLDVFPVLYAVSTQEAFSTRLLVAIFDASVFAAALVSALWYFIKVLQKYCEWYRFFVLEQEPYLSDFEDEPDELPVGSFCSRSERMGEGAGIQLSVVGPTLSASAKGSATSSSLASHTQWLSQSQTQLQPSSPVQSTRSMHSHSQRRFRISTARQLRLGAGARDNDEMRRRNLCYRLCRLVDTYWRRPRNLFLRRTAPWAVIGLIALSVFNSILFWQWSFVMETLMVLGMLVGVLVSYCVPHPKRLSPQAEELFASSFSAIASTSAASASANPSVSDGGDGFPGRGERRRGRRGRQNSLLSSCFCYWVPAVRAIFLRVRAFIRGQTLWLPVARARRVALLALAHCLFCMRGRLNLNWYHVMLSMLFAAFCVIRMAAYYLSTCHPYLWIMELVLCLCATAVSAVSSGWQAWSGDASLGEVARLPVLLVLCHFGLPSAKFVQRGRAFKRAEQLLIAGALFWLVLLLMSLSLGLGFSEMGRTVEPLNMSPDCYGQAKCLYLDTQGHYTPEPYSFCSFKTWDTGVTVTDFALLSLLTYYDVHQVQGSLQRWFPGWKIRCYNLHTSKENLMEEACLGRKYPSAEIRRQDWTSFIEFVPPGEQFSVIAVRGTMAPIEILVDINIWLTTLLLQGLAFIGPTTIYTRMQYWTAKTVELARKIYPSDHVINQFRLVLELCDQRMSTGVPVYMTGHSLGGGIAMLAGLVTSGTGPPLRTVTFNSPSTYLTAHLLGLVKEPEMGDHTLYDEQVLTSIHVKTESDPVSATDFPVGTVFPLRCHAKEGSICHSIQQALCEILSRCGDDGRDLRVRLREDTCRGPWYHVVTT